MMTEGQSMWTRRLWMTLAALSGFVGVAAGAFGAHGLNDPTAKEVMRTGSNYELVHALATILCSTFITAGARGARFAPALFLGGTVLFSGSLYGLALGAPHWTGIVTPFGGLMFLAGWLVLAWAARGVDQTPR
jgi:uncharacterized membrane protein YgdD (TMEM256/DUF423 family)